MPITFPVPAPLRLLLRALALLSFSALIAACAGVKPQAYEQAKPTLDLEAYFDGPLKAWGMFEDRKGQVVRRFTVDIVGTWRNGVGTLEEDFVYDDGETERRVWTIAKGVDGRYTGTADDVIGEANGQASGNALNWTYTLALPVGDSVYNVKLDDWMYLIDDRVMINRATMSYFGFRVGEVTITFYKDRSTAQ
ncbi:MAG: DUF3833 domain-containing protein [Burkholderiaceae bacterium]